MTRMALALMLAALAGAVSPVRLPAGLLAQQAAPAPRIVRFCPGPGATVQSPYHVPCSEVRHEQDV